MVTENRPANANVSYPDVGYSGLMIKPAALRVDDAAKYLGVSRSKLYALIKEGKITSLLIGGRRLIRVAILDMFLMEQEQFSVGA